MPGSPDRWLEVRVSGLAADDVPFVAERLVAGGARGVLEEPEGLVTHFAPPADPQAFTAALSADIRTLSGSADVTWRWQAHEDWETLWRQGLGPRRIGERLVVRPSWTPYDAGDGDLVLTLDPGVAFGTAEHGTTRNALRLIEGRVAAGDRVADVGTGTGILAMAAVLLGAEHAVAWDTDPWACETARENLRLNGLTVRVTVVDGPMPAEGPPFDGTVANIEWIRLRPLVPHLVSRTAPGGWLVLSGILLSQRGEALEHCAALGLTEVAQVEDGEWWAAAFARAGA